MQAFLIVCFAILALAASHPLLNTTSTCICTTVACPVSGTNHLTEGGGGEGSYVYAMHNGHAVVTSASAKISPATLDKGTDTTSCTQDYARSLDDDGTADCDAGHILAHRLGGLGNQPINIFPQDLSINRGAYAQFENKIYDCVKSGASSAALKWTFQYESSSKTKPVKVTYTATMTGGDCTTVSETFTN